LGGVGGLRQPRLRIFFLYVAPVLRIRKGYTNDQIGQAHSIDRKGTEHFRFSTKVTNSPETLEQYNRAYENISRAHEDAAQMISADAAAFSDELQTMFKNPRKRTIFEKIVLLYRGTMFMRESNELQMRTCRVFIQK
jgi:hypothetical protein